MMVVFDQLYISKDGKKLYIALYVKRSSAYDNIYLDQITVVTADKVAKNTPDITPSDYIYQTTFGENENKRMAIIELDDTLLNQAFNNGSSGNPCATYSINGGFSKQLLFVYVKCKKGDNASVECFPCDAEHIWTSVGVAYDKNLLYQTAMSYTKDMATDCQIPNNFVDFILRWNALDAAIGSGHYYEATEFWEALFDNNAKGYVSIKKCGCHG